MCPPVVDEICVKLFSPVHTSWPSDRVLGPPQVQRPLQKVFALWNILLFEVHKQCSDWSKSQQRLRWVRQPSRGFITLIPPFDENPLANYLLSLLPCLSELWQFPADPFAPFSFQPSLFFLVVSARCFAPGWKWLSSALLCHYLGGYSLPCCGAMLMLRECVFKENGWWLCFAVVRLPSAKHVAGWTTTWAISTAITLWWPSWSRAITCVIPLAFFCVFFVDVRSYFPCRFYQNLKPFCKVVHYQGKSENWEVYGQLFYIQRYKNGGLSSICILVFGICIHF